MPLLYSIVMPGLAVSKRLALADARQIITNAHAGDSNTLQVLSAQFTGDGDTLQKLFISPCYSAAMPGLATGTRLTHPDTEQIVTNAHQAAADTKQIVSASHIVFSDTKQIIFTAFVAMADTLTRIRAGFWFNGEHIYDHGGQLLTGSTFDGIPETREVTMDIPGRSGTYYFGTVDGERVHRLRVGFSVPKTHQATIEELAAWLTPRIGEAKLVFDAQPDRYCNMRVTRKWQVPGRPLWVEFDVEFKASDPYIYAFEKKSYTAAGGSPLSLGLENPGSIETPAEITLTPQAGQVTDVTLQLGTQIMTIAGPFTMALVIDTATMTALTGGANAAGQVGGDWLEIPPGASELTVSWTGGDMTVDVSFRPRWN